jgi:TonB family protein
MQASTRPVASVSARPAAPRPEISTARSDWTRAPRLDEPDPCSGFFPRHAVADVGRVALVVVIDSGGRVASTSVADESPPGDGFGQAARTCLGTKIFKPALDRDGRPTGATATVRIRFSR